MNRNEMIKNVKALNIPGLNVNLAMTVDEIKETVRNAMFERFVSTVASYSEFCGLSAIRDTREFAVDFIKSNDYVKKCLKVTINLVLNGGFSDMWSLRGFVHRLLWSHVVEACQDELVNNVTCYDDDENTPVNPMRTMNLWSTDDDDDERSIESWSNERYSFGEDE